MAKNKKEKNKILQIARVVGACFGMIFKIFLEIGKGIYSAFEPEEKPKKKKKKKGRGEKK